MRNSKPPRNGHRYQVEAYIRTSHQTQGSNAIKGSKGTADSAHALNDQQGQIRQALDTHYGAGQYDLKWF